MHSKSIITSLFISECAMLGRYYYSVINYCILMLDTLLFNVMGTEQREHIVIPMQLSTWRREIVKYFTKHLQINWPMFHSFNDVHK